MDFETRLEDLYKSKSGAVPIETDAAVRIYERLVTAKAICSSVLGYRVPASVVATVLEQLSDEAWALTHNEDRLLSDDAE